MRAEDRCRWALAAVLATIALPGLDQSARAGESDLRAGERIETLTIADGLTASQAARLAGLLGPPSRIAAYTAPAGPTSDPSILASLEGSWTVRSVTMNGRLHGDEDLLGATFTFRGGELSMSGSKEPAASHSCTVSDSLGRRIGLVVVADAGRSAFDAEVATARARGGVSRAEPDLGADALSITQGPDVAYVTLVNDTLVELSGRVRPEDAEAFRSLVGRVLREVGRPRSR